MFETFVYTSGLLLASFVSDKAFKNYVFFAKRVALVCGFGIKKGDFPHLTLQTGTWGSETIRTLLQ